MSAKKTQTKKRKAKILDTSRTMNAAEQSLLESFRYIRSRHERAAILVLAVALSSGSLSPHMDEFSVRRVLGLRRF